MARKIGVSKEAPKSSATPLGAKTAKGSKARTVAPKSTVTTGPDSVETYAAKASEVPSNVETHNPSVQSSEPVATVAISKGKHMSLVLQRGKVGKSGKKALFTSVALRRGITVPASIFAGGVFPETLSLEGDGFVTLGEEEQKKAEARNAKRLEKGLKPKPTPQERQAQLTARQAKLEAKLKRAQEASAKLAARLGNLPAAPTGQAETASAAV